MTRYTLHGMWPSGPAYKVGLMLKLTGTPHNYQHVNLQEGEHRGEAYLVKNRFGKVPAMEDHEAGLCLVESSNILDYLADETGQFGGKDRAERLQAREWQSWAAGTLANGIYRTRAAKFGFFTFPDEVAAANEQAGLDGLKALDGHLEGKEWLVGDGATIADIDLYAIAGYAGQARMDISEYANIARWMKNVEGLDGFMSIDDGLPKESVTA